MKNRKPAIRSKAFTGNVTKVDLKYLTFDTYELPPFKIDIDVDRFLEDKEEKT